MQTLGIDEIRDGVGRNCKIWIELIGDGCVIVAWVHIGKVVVPIVDEEQGLIGGVLDLCIIFGVKDR